MSKWYYSVDGRAEGPVDEAVIVESLTSGKLTLVDLIFREGDDGWRTVGEVPQFKDAFATVNLPPNPASGNVPGADGAAPSDAEPFQLPDITGEGRFRFQNNPDLSWVLLARSSGAGEDKFHQSGPYSAEQIESMLAHKECKYSDYVWRPGYRKWARIGNLPEFDRRRRSRDGDRISELVPFPEVEIDTPAERKEFVENLMRTKLDAPNVIDSDTAPPETDGRDFTEITAPQFDVQAAQRELEAKVSPPRIGPPPIERFNAPLPPIDKRGIDTPPQVPQFPPSLSSADADNKTVVYAGGVRVGGAAVADMSAVGSDGASADDGKTMVYSRPPGFDPMVPTSASGAASAPPRFDPDATMVQTRQQTLPGTGTDPGASPLGPEDGLYFEEAAPSRHTLWKRFQKPLLAAGVAMMLVIGTMHILEMRSEGGVGTEEDSKTSVTSTPRKKKPADKQADKQAAKPAQPPVAKPGVNLDETASAALASVNEPIHEPVRTASTPAESKTTPEEPGVSLAGIRPVAPGAGKVTVLELIPVRADGVKTQFAVNTNAAVGDTIYISLLARSGEVLRYPSFFTTASVRRASGEIPTFDFSSLKLPPGQYRVEVAAGEMRRTQNVFIGQKNGDFEASLERHLKDISFQQQTEKKALFHSARLMEGLAKALSENYFSSRTDARKWRAFYLGWKKDVQKASQILVDRVAPERRNELAYPDEIIALKIAAKKLFEQADALNDSILSNTQARDVAGAGNLAIVREFSRIRTIAATISSRRTP